MDIPERVYICIWSLALAAPALEDHYPPVVDAHNRDTPLNAHNPQVAVVKVKVSNRPSLIRRIQNMKTCLQMWVGRTSAVIPN